MPSITLPRLPDDDRTYYYFLPQKATLYGADTAPRRFLRVVDDRTGSRFMNTYLDRPDDPTSVVVTESVEVQDFLRYATFGYTPYIECLLSGLGDIADFEEHSEYFMSQAVLRNYEQRCKALLDLCESKQLSISAFMRSDEAAELVAETNGALTCWEMLMNTGNIKAFNCLDYVETPTGISIPLAQLREKFDLLQGRLLTSNHVDLPYKVMPDARERFLAAFK